MRTRSERFEEILTVLQNIIADLTGNEIEDVDPYSHLEDDLGITEIDFKRILAEIDSDFGITLNKVDIEDEVEIVKELALFIQEETELG